ncbi:MAG: glycoside hydrolase family 2 TIM barrel-domain containing protein, partial [Bacteroidota bacterium]
FSAKYPLYVDLYGLLHVTLPLIFFLYINRLYVQRWTLERQERGFHFWGGVLLLNTWWVYLLGFIYTFFRVKVPYIPTPKSDAVEDEWKICWPNLLVMSIGIGAIVYGLKKDWSPYSFFMAGLVATNVFMLCIGVLTAQRKSISKIYYLFKHGRLSRSRQLWSKFRHDIVYRGLRSDWVAGTLATLLIAVMMAPLILPIKPQVTLAELEEGKTIHHYEGIKWGIEAEDVESMPSQALDHIHSVNVNMTWDTTSANAGGDFDQAFASGMTPHVSWILPFDSNGEFSQKAMAGHFDQYLRRVAHFLGTRRELLYLSLHPDSIGILPDQGYHQTWDYIHSFFEEENITNVKWLFPSTRIAGDVASQPSYFRRADFLWFEVPGPGSLLKELAAREDLTDQDSLPPVFLTGIKPDSLFASSQWIQVAQSGLAIENLQTADFFQLDLPDLLGGHREVQRALGIEVAPVRSLAIASGLPRRDDRSGRNFFSKDEHGQFVWEIDGKPFYVQGVAYNPGHDWRDGYAPLVRERLEEDFEAIKSMGANTIRRYSPSIYDQNILNVAEEQALKVLYGFWFDPQVDYYANLTQIEDYKEEVIDKVRRFKHHPAVLAWCIGNETWGILKQYNDEDYTEKVRRAYMSMLED